MVGAVGIEPTTPWMSTKCSPAELRALKWVNGTMGAKKQLAYQFDTRRENYDVNVVPNRKMAENCRFCCRLSGNSAIMFPSCSR